MPYNPATDVDRRNRLGASEAAAVLGLNPWRCALEVYDEKVGEAPAQEETDGNARTDWGRRLEPVILEWWYDKNAGPVTAFKMNDRPLVHPAHSWLSATPDGIGTLLRGSGPDVQLLRIVVDAKASESPERWASGLPPDVDAQLRVQMACADAAEAYAAVMIGLRGAEFVVERDRRIEDDMIGRLSAFWHDHVLKRVPPDPDGSPATAAYLARRYGAAQVEKAAHVVGTLDDEELIRYLLTLKDTERQLDAAKAEAENKLKERIGNATKLVTPNGFTASWSVVNGSVSYKAICDELAVPKEIMEAHRGSPYRRFAISVPK